MQKLVISGYTGFVGRNLVDQLSQSYKIVGVGRNEMRSAHELNCTEITRWADMNVTSLNGALAAIHLAGKAHDIHGVSSEDEYFKANTDLTIDFFNVFLKSDARDFIYFSSVKAVADKVDNVLDESCIANPKTAYGRSKQEAERYLLAQPLDRGKRLIILRPCMIHGPGNKGNLNLLYKFVSHGFPYPLAAFDNYRSFLGIDNLCYIVQKILDNKEISSGIYNVSDDNPLATNVVVELMSKAMGRQTRLLKIPKPLLRLGARIGDICNFPLNSERLRKLTENYVVSNSKIKGALNITQLPVSVEEGLFRTIKSFSLK